MLQGALLAGRRRGPPCSSLLPSFLPWPWQEEGLVAGIRGVEWDAVELPSQFMENWFVRVLK